MRHLRAALLLLALLVPAMFAGQASAVSSDPVAISHDPGTEDVFMRGEDNQLWHTYFTPAGWGGWESLGGGVQGTPSAVSWGSNHMDVFVRGTDNGLYHRYWNGSSWAPWARIGNWQIASDPEAISWGYGVVLVFAKGMDNAMIMTYYPSGSSANDGWADWSSFGGVITGKPSAVTWTPGHVDIYARGSDARIYHRYAVNGAWNAAWEAIGNRQSGQEPFALAPQYGATDVFTVDTNFAVNHNWYANGAWQPDFTSLGGATISQPRGIAPGRNGKEDLFARGTDNYVYHKWFPGPTDWSAWTRIGDYQITGNVSVLSWNANHEAIFARGLDGALVTTYMDTTGAWQPWQNLGAPGSYATSWNYGGSDHTVNTDDEARSVTSAQNAASDGGTALWNALSPADRARYPELNPAYDAATALEAIDDLSSGTSGNFDPTATAAEATPGYLSLKAVGCSLYHNGFTFASPKQYWVGDLGIFGCSAQVKILHVGWDFIDINNNVIRHYNNNNYGVVARAKANPYFNSLAYQATLKKIHKGTSSEARVHSLKICIEAIPWGFPGAQKGRGCNTISRKLTA